MANVVDIFTGGEWEVKRDLHLEFRENGIGFNEPRVVLTLIMSEESAQKLLKMSAGKPVAYRWKGILDKSLVESALSDIIRHSNLWWGQV